MIRIRTILEVLLEALSQRRSAVVAVILTTFVVAGVALTQMPLQLLPEIQYPQVRVIGDLPGQTSKVIEESVNEPLEAALAGTAGVVQMESRSGDGRAYIDLFFEPDYDLDRALQDVSQGASRARSQMPGEFPDPRIFAVATGEEPVLQFAFNSVSLSAPEIRQRLRAGVVPRLQAISGVDQVYIGREENAELVVDVDPIRQTELGIELSTLEEVLLQATEPPPSSVMRTPTFEGIGLLGTNEWSAKGLGEQPLGVQGAARPVALDAVANTHRRPSEESLRTRLDGRASVLVTVHRSPNAHALTLAEQARAVVDEVSGGERFEAIESTVLYDDSVVTGSAVQSVVVAAVGGALLAMLLLSLTMRRKRQIPLVALVVGTSLSAAIVTLHLMGLSLNLLTLAGLLISVGLGLDYAIIYFDRFDRRIREHSSSAAVEAMVDVAGPLFGALLTTLAAVLPFLLVKGLVALLFQPLIWTVVVCAIFSFLFAVVLLPTFSGSMSTAPEGDDDGEASEVKNLGWWRTLHHPLLAWAIVAACGGAVIWAAKSLPFEVLPVVDDGFVEMRITHPAGIPTDSMDRITRRVEGQLLDVDGTDALFTTVGGYFREGLPSFRPGTANFMVRVDTDDGERPSSEWAQDARGAIDALEIAELNTRVTLPRIRGVQTRLADADLIVVLTRDDGDLLAMAELETRVIRELETIEGLVDIERMRAGVSPRWVVRPDHELLSDYGIEPKTLRHVIDYALEGRVVRERMESGEPLALRVRYDRDQTGGPQQLADLRLSSMVGTDVRFGDVVDFELIEEPTHIERREGQRVVRVAATLDPDGPGPADVAAGVEQALAQLDYPDGVSWWLEGEIDALEETQQTFGLALLLALMMVLTLLVIQYGSFAYAAAGLLSIPLTASGALLLLMLLGRPLDAMVLAGLLIAVGIVANNVILVLTEARRLAGNAESRRAVDALRIAARRRLRPIVLTVLSTVLGMSPLLWGGAEVFGLLQPLAIALTGALLVSIPVACFALPGITQVFLMLADRLGSFRSQS